MSVIHLSSDDIGGSFDGFSTVSAKVLSVKDVAAQRGCRTLNRDLLLVICHTPRI